MHTQYRLISFFLILSLPLLTRAQDRETDITGLWKGTLYNDTTKRTLRYEVGISPAGKGKYTGFSHTWFDVGDRSYFGVKKVKVKWAKDGKLVIEDDGLLTNNYPEDPARGVRQLNILTLEVKDSILELNGPFSTNRTREYSPLTGTIHLMRRNDYRQSSLIPHLQELGLADEKTFMTPAQQEQAIALSKIKQEPVIAVAEPRIPKPVEGPLSKPETISVQAIPQVKLPAEPVATETPKAKPVPKPQPKPVVVRTEPVTVKATPPAQPPVTTTVTKPAEPVLVKTDPKPPLQNIFPELPANSKAAADVDKRSTETIETLFFKSDSLQLTLYDNGEVDGDTVSVLMNGRVIMPMQGLSTNAIRKTIYTGGITDSIQLVMYAETLGTIPPNTGLLIVYDGDDRYEIRFSGDFRKSAAIVFRKKKD